MATAHEAPDAHDHDHGQGHDDHGHGHDDHGPADDAWVLPPILIGVVIGIVLIVVLGLGTDAAPFS